MGRKAAAVMKVFVLYVEGEMEEAQEKEEKVELCMRSSQPHLRKKMEVDMEQQNGVSLYLKKKKMMLMKMMSIVLFVH